jgi:hypothetical protein
MRKVDAAVLSQNILDGLPSLDVGLQGFDDTEDTHNCMTQITCLVETATKSSRNVFCIVLCQRA